ncbi:membrane-bound lytic murein transglycosylase MltF [Halioxenophilus aromaticivorans]|uniref:Membrane-bound lytic murein transglycosylase F n=1 Tax=Halioxenophilus aromaticivorans TaxID=1306992 RepID=A0AAV3TYV6_9ALTE
MHQSRRASDVAFELLLTVLFIGVVVVLCLRLSGSHQPTELERIFLQGELHVVSRNGPTTYYEGANGITGLEYDLIKGFAEHLGVTLVVHEQENLTRLVDEVAEQKYDMAAAGLTITQDQQDLLRFALPYHEVSELLIYNRNNPAPESFDDLTGKTLVVMAGSAHAETLRQLQLDYPQLQWAEHSEADMNDLIEMVHRGEIDYTIANSNAFNMSEPMYPRAGVAMELSHNRQLAWALPQSLDNSLFNKAQAYLRGLQLNGELDELIASYEVPLDLDRGGALTIAQRIESRLPRWEEQLRNAGQEHNLEWELLAAVSYQESHWNAKAKSYTGVRGLMMLTQAAAKDMGVTNRLDPIQSINGGTKYLKSIYDRISATVTGEDRLWMALAAYNAGLGHLEDARTLTTQMGGDANRWLDVKERLPLLAKRKYYRNLKHGYARGWEPVEYVENIQRYRTIIAWHNTFKRHNIASGGADPHSDVRPVTFLNNTALPYDLPAF